MNRRNTIEQSLSCVPRWFSAMGIIIGWVFLASVGCVNSSSRVAKIVSDNVVAKPAPIHARALPKQFEFGNMAIGRDGTIYVIKVNDYCRIWSIDATGKQGVLIGQEEGKPCQVASLGGGSRPEEFDFLISVGDNVFVADLKSIWRLGKDRRLVPFVGCAAAECEDDLPIDGRGGWARFARIAGITASQLGELYILDDDDQGSITLRRVDAKGQVSTLARLSRSLTVNNETKEFGNANSLAVGLAGEIYVAGDYSTIVRLEQDGYLTVLPNPSTCPTGEEYCRFQLSTDSQGQLYALDTSANAISVWSVEKGWRVIPWLGLLPKEQTGGGIVGSGGINSFAIDSFDRLVVFAETDQGLILASINDIPVDSDFQLAPIDWIEEGANEKTPASKGGREGIEKDTAVLELPPGVMAPASPWCCGNSGLDLMPYPILENAIAAQDKLCRYAAAMAKDAKPDPEIIHPMTAELTIWFDRLSAGGLTVLPDGDVLVADFKSHTVVRITADGRAHLAAGMPGEGGWSEGEVVDNHLNNPYGFIPSPWGTTFVLDQVSENIRELCDDGKIINREIGWGSVFSGGVDPQGRLWAVSCNGALLFHINREGDLSSEPLYTEELNLFCGENRIDLPGPGRIGMAPDGRLFITYPWFGIILERGRDGKILRVFGKPLTPGRSDGPAWQARFFFPAGIAIDKTGRVFVSDTLNHTIRVIATDGVVKTLAGSPGVPGLIDGMGNDARLDTPSALTVGPDGRLFVLDQAGSAVRIVDSSGRVKTLFRSKATRKIG